MPLKDIKFLGFSPGKAQHENPSYRRQRFHRPVRGQATPQAAIRSRFSIAEKPAPRKALKKFLGNRQFLQDHQPDFRRQKFDVVIDFILSSGRQAQQLMDTFRGIAGRVVALSSMDVYRAWGVFYNSEPGGLQELPLTEDSDLRTSRYTYPPEVLKKLQTIYAGWMTSMTRFPWSRPCLAIPNFPAPFCGCP